MYRDNNKNNYNNNNGYKPKVSKFKELRKLIDPEVQKVWNEEQIYLRDQLI